MTFSSIVIILMLLGAIYHYKNSIWRKLSRRYSTDWQYRKWSGMETLYVWDEISQSWLNEVSIDIGEEGLAIYFPFYSRFMPSVLIPWDDIEVQGKVYKGANVKLKIDCFARLKIRVITTDVYLGIRYSHMAMVVDMQNIYRKRAGV